MDIAKSVRRINDPSAYAVEAWMYVPHNGSQLLVASQDDTPIAPLLEALFSVVKERMEHPKVNNDVMYAIDSYMKDDINIVLESLSKSGIEENSFTALMEDMSLISDKEQISSEHFIAAEKKIIDMFSLKMNNDAMNGKITLEELKEKCEDFGGLMFSSDLELYAVYPGYFEMKDSKQLFDYAKMGMKSLEKTQQIIAEKEAKSL